MIGLESLRSCKWTAALALLFPLALLAGCQSAPSAAPAAASEAAVPATVPSGARRFAVDPAASEIRLLVYRSGALARFGHDHVIVGRVRGEIFAGASAAASGFRLEIPVAALEVDPPQARAEEGGEFSTPVSPQAQEATRANMLGPDVLDAQHHASIAVASVSLRGPRWDPTVLAQVTLRGVARSLSFPAAVFEQNDRLVVVASFDIRQSDFGIVPYSVLGGGLRVRDSIHVRIRVAAQAGG